MSAERFRRLPPARLSQSTRCGSRASPAVSSNPVTAHCRHCTLAGMCSGSSTASIMAAVALLVRCAALGTPPVDVFFARLCLVMQRMSGTGCLVDLSGSLSSDPAFSRGCRGPEAQTTSAGSWGSSRRHVLLVGRLIVLMASCKPSAVPNVWFTALWLGVWVQQGCSVFPELPSPRGYAWCLCVWP